jgi:hypothetical protein
VFEEIKRTFEGDVMKEKSWKQKMHEQKQELEKKEAQERREKQLVMVEK